MSTRTEKSLTWSYAEGRWFATCVNCQTAYAYTLDQIMRDRIEPELTPCADDFCTAILCPSCSTFKCEGCDLLHCSSHAIDLSGSKFCPSCVRGIAADGELTTDQEWANFLAAMAQAGCSEQEAKAGCSEQEAKALGKQN